MAGSVSTGPFAGLDVALPGTPDFDAASRLLRREAAVVQRWPAAEEALTQRSIESFILELAERQYDSVIFPTGQSVRLLIELARQFDREEQVVDALRAMQKIAQGPKTASILEQNGLTADLRSPQPTAESLISVLRRTELVGRVVGVAARGAEPQLMELLEQGGATVRIMSESGYAAPPLLRLLDTVLDARLGVIVFGSASQVTQLWDAASLRNTTNELRIALGRARIIAVGAAASLALRQRGIRVDLTTERSTFVRPVSAELGVVLGVHGENNGMGEAVPGRRRGANKKTVLVVGNGMVSHRFCEKLREYDKDSAFDIVVLGEEPRPAYDRVRLTAYFETKDPTKLQLCEPEWYKSQGIKLILGERATKLQRKQRAVLSSSGAWIHYDHVVLCTGSLPFVPPVPGMDKQGVNVYRTIEDVEQIANQAASARRAVVVGGGLLGLEAAKALLDLGVETHVVESAPRLMPRQLDAAGARLLENSIRALGVHIHLGVSLAELVGDERVRGVLLQSGELLEVDMVVVAAGIRPRDELAREAGLRLGERGGIWVDDNLCTSDANVFALGECVVHRDVCYGLVAPCYEMADVLAKNLVGVEARFAGADQSAKLKLLGVDVASFGDPFVDPAQSKAVIYEDLVNRVYKKLAVSNDGKHLLGGILVGDASQYAQLASFARSKKPLPQTPEELLFGKRDSGDDAAALDVDAQVCSCNNVTKGAICDAIKRGACSYADLKAATRAGSGCGGCAPLVSDILAAEFKAAGKVVYNHVCEHFKFSRQELYQIIKINKLRTFEQVIASHGAGRGCELCKPVVASILASVFNEPILNHEGLQDTNDRFLANVQRGGLYSVVPRIPAGEITPEKLIAIGDVAKKYGLYTKITGGQRIDLLGARLEQLPDIWRELIAAGFESGHAYGKAMRTVKSCVGSTWCRYGVQDSVGLAIKIEERYKGVRAPHKLKSAVSGCIRECAEAQSKDFGVIATEKGWNLYLCGNGGAKPRHADLFASDLDEQTVIKYLDRFIMYYIATADKLTRTSVWLEKMEGGIEYLRDVIINDRLGICEQLEREMQYLVDSYTCEWADVVNDPKKRARFRHFANSDEMDSTIRFVTERGQRRPADWKKLPPPAKKVHLPIVRATWVKLARVDQVPRDGSVTIKYGNTQIALFNFSSRGQWYASQNMCPHTRDMVLSRGLIGEHGGQPKVACPMHKKTFSLESGECLSGESYRIHTFPVKIEDGAVFVELPPVADLERAITASTHDCEGEACHVHGSAA